MGEWVCIQNVVRENNKFVAEVQLSYGGLSEKVPLTKKLIKRAIKSMVVRLDLFEVMINNKVDDFDNFVKAAFVANENFSKYEFPLFRSCVEKLPSAPDTEDEEALSEWDKQVVEARLKFVAKVESELPRKPLTADQIYEKEKNNRMMISILSQIVEFRNGESGAHVLHINIITELILERLIQKTDKYDLSGAVRGMIVTASALHDIGKILNKPGRLTNEEFEVIKTHSVIGASMLESLEYYKDEPLVRIAHDICRWHHERYDGKGYPDGLKGEEIPISAQVVALADVYDALISDRVYKKAYSHEKAVEMILNGECGAFNPLLIECLEDSQSRIRYLASMTAERFS